MLLGGCRRGLTVWAQFCQQSQSSRKAGFGGLRPPRGSQANFPPAGTARPVVEGPLSNGPPHPGDFPLLQTIRSQRCLSASPLEPELPLPAHSLLSWLGLFCCVSVPRRPCIPGLPPTTGPCCGPGHRERPPESSAQRPTIPFPDGSLPWRGGAEAAGAEWGLLFCGSHREAVSHCPPRPPHPHPHGGDSLALMLGSE